MEDFTPIIGKYYIKPKYTKFKKIINKNNISWKEININPNAIDYLECNPDKINWEFLSLNENAISR
jgi:hypothetical protein